MKIEVSEEKNWLMFIPEDNMDYFYLGLINNRMPSIANIVRDTDNPEPRLESFRISIWELTKFLSGIRI